MIFDNDNERISNEEILLTEKPNLIFSSKKVILAFILFAFILGSASPIISYIANLQVYMIGYVKIPITSYVVIAIFVLALLILVWIIFQLLGWYFTEYIITNVRIITKSGFIRKNKSYMGYKNIQDIQVSQSIIARIFKVGTVSIYSAYDKTDVELKHIKNPKKIEEILFTEMNKSPQDNYLSQRNAPQYYPDQYDEDIYPIHNQEYSKKHYSTPYDEDLVSYENLNQQLDNELYYNDFDDKEFDKSMEEDIKQYNGNLKFQPRKESSVKKSHVDDYEVYNPYTEFENELINEEIRDYPVYSSKQPYNKRSENHHNQGYDEYSKEEQYQVPRGHYQQREPHYNSQREPYYKDNSQRDNYHNQYPENNQDYYRNMESSHYQKNSQDNTPYYSHNSQDNINTSKKTEDIKKDKESVLAKHAQKFKKN